MHNKYMHNYSQLVEECLRNGDFEGLYPIVRNGNVQQEIRLAAGKELVNYYASENEPTRIANIMRNDDLPVEIRDIARNALDAIKLSQQHSTDSKSIQRPGTHTTGRPLGPKFRR